MERHYAFRYRLEPTPEQAELMRSYAGACRWVYNAALEYRTTTYRQWVARGRDPENRPVSAWQGLAKELPVSRGPGKVAADDPLAWLTECPKHLLQQALINLDRAFANFFNGRARYPKRHRRGVNDSFRVPEAKSVRFERGRHKYVGLPKLGWVRMSVSARSAKRYGVRFDHPYRGTLKHATVSYRRGEWWISLCCEIETPEANPGGLSEVGIDMGIAQPLTVSDGTVISLPKISDTEWAKTRRLQRAVSRKRRGSANRRKAQDRLNSHLHKLTNRRNDAAHKATTALTKSHSRIVIEDLQVRNMTKSAKGTKDDPGNHIRQKAGLNRAMLDIAPGTLRRMLEYKGSWYGCEIIAVPPRNTSRQCAECGHLPKRGEPENRESQDRFVCKSCGVRMNADHNAARNILAAGSAVTACQVLETTRNHGTESSNRKSIA